MSQRTFLGIRDIQLTEYDILKKVVTFLDKNQLQYILCGGTMLGAVRHHGFIPWDDDIDILVPREDYETLKTLLSNNPNSVDGIVFRLPGAKDSLYPFIKAENPLYKCIDDRFANSLPLYIWIDIFPLDHFPDEENKHRRMVRRISFWKTILYSGILSKEYWKSRFQNNYLKLVKYKVAYFIYSIMNSHCGVSKRIDRIAKKMNDRYSTSNHVGDGAWPEGMKDYFKCEWTFPTIKKLFEKDEFNIPENYDSYLKQFYGDYMTPPPEHKRTGHHITVYKED